MKKIIFTGLLPDVTEKAVKESLEKVGPVLSVSIIRDGDAQSPVVIVQIDISDAQVFSLTEFPSDFLSSNQTALCCQFLLHAGSGKASSPGAGSDTEHRGNTDQIVGID